MSALYDLYQPGETWIHRLDPRTKLLLVICASALQLLYTNLWFVAGALLLTHLALWSARSPRERLTQVWRAILPTMVMIVVLWVVVYPGDGPVLFSFWIIEITVYSLVQGVTVALRIGALAFTVLLWPYTTDQAILVRSLVSLGLPYEWGLTLAMALRYLPTMAQAFRMVSDAQQARALDLTQKNPLRRARAYMPIVVAMLISAFRTAENLSRALESRALGASGRTRTYLRQLRFRIVDLVWTVAILVVTVALIWARYAAGLGAHPLRLIQ